MGQPRDDLHTAYASLSPTATPAGVPLSRSSSKTQSSSHYDDRKVAAMDLHPQLAHTHHRPTGSEHFSEDSADFRNLLRGMLEKSESEGSQHSNGSNSVATNSDSSEHNSGSVSYNLFQQLWQNGDLDMGSDHFNIGTAASNHNAGNDHVDAGHNGHHHNNGSHSYNHNNDNGNGIDNNHSGNHNAGNNSSYYSHYNYNDYNNNNNNNNGNNSHQGGKTAEARCSFQSIDSDILRQPIQTDLESPEHFHSGSTASLSALQKPAQPQALEALKMGIRPSVPTSVSSLPSPPLPSPPVARTHVVEPEVKFQKHHSDQWMSRYKQLLHHFRQHRTCYVDSRSAQDKSLITWIKRQRNQYKLKQQGKHSTLTDERQRMLEALGFVWDPHEATWNHRFAELVQFKHEHGHTNVPLTYPPNPQLGIWVKGQRKQRWDDLNKNVTIRAERYRKLESIGFRWVIRGSKAKGGM